MTLDVAVKVLDVPVVTQHVIPSALFSLPQGIGFKRDTLPLFCPSFSARAHKRKLLPKMLFAEALC